MSAERFEITLSDDGRIHISGSNGRSATLITPDGIIGYVTHGAIRQQARDIAELEVFAEIGRQWNTDSSLAKWFPLTADRLGQDAQEIAKLRTDLAAAVALTAARDETIAELELRLRISRQSNKELRESVERAEARLAAIEAAPTVAMLCPLTESAFNESTLMTAYQKAKMPHVELIARPAKD